MADQQVVAEKVSTPRKADANTLAAELYELRKVMTKLLSNDEYDRSQRRIGGYTLVVMGIAAGVAGLAMPPLLTAGAILGGLGVVRLVGE